MPGLVLEIQRISVFPAQKFFLSCVMSWNLNVMTVKGGQYGCGGLCRPVREVRTVSAIFLFNTLTWMDSV